MKNCDSEVFNGIRLHQHVLCRHFCLLRNLLFATLEALLNDVYCFLQIWKIELMKGFLYSMITILYFKHFMVCLKFICISFAISYIFSVHRSSTYSETRICLASLKTEAYEEFLVKQNLEK